MIRNVNRQTWIEEDSSSVLSAEATVALEEEAVLLLPQLGFGIQPGEEVHFSPAVAVAKNVSFDPLTDRLRGTAHTDPGLKKMLRRFSESAAALADSLFPAYRGRLQRARASFRPAEIAGRRTTWRHDDTRLHIDSFPATPVQGRRILRVFTNVNPEGRVRSWRVGEPFERVAARFGDRLRIPLQFTLELMRLTGITKSLRSPYDALMLQLHDLMKADLDYQSRVAQTAVDFPAGSTWIAFTDAVSHAAMAGQYQLEQTLLLPVDAMLLPAHSPLKVLERLKGRHLV
jgi:3-deoxy-D-manno-octulosonic acid hydroxylase-like protein